MRAKWWVVFVKIVKKSNKGLTEQEKWVKILVYAIDWGNVCVS